MGCPSGGGGIIKILPFMFYSPYFDYVNKSEQNVF